MIDDSTWICLTIFLNACGVMALVAARLSERWFVSRTLQAVFLLTLLMIGINAICTFQAGNVWWLWSAVLLFILPVGATIDFRRTSQRSVSF